MPRTNPLTKSLFKKLSFSTIAIALFFSALLGFKLYQDAHSPTAGWRTYKNQAHHYTLKYPANWQVDQRPGSTEVYDPQQYSGQSFYTGLSITHEGTLEEIREGWSDLGPRVEGTKLELYQTKGTVSEPYPRDEYYVAIPNTNEYLRVSGISHTIVTEETNQTLLKIFESMRF